MTNPTTPAGGGMPKWLIILLVLLLVVVLGCCGGIATCIFLARKAAQKVAENAPAFQQTIMDAAKEQAKANGVEINTPDAAGITALPSNFPNDIPTYSGAKTLQSVGKIKEDAGDVMLQTTDAASDVKDFYSRQMTDQGWKEESNSSQGADTYILSYSKDDRAATVTINHSGKETTILLGYEKKK